MPSGSSLYFHSDADLLGVLGAVFNLLVRLPAQAGENACQELSIQKATAQHANRIIKRNSSEILPIGGRCMYHMLGICNPIDREKKPTRLTVL